LGIAITKFVDANIDDTSVIVKFDETLEALTGEALVNFTEGISLDFLHSITDIVSGFDGGVEAAASQITNVLG